MYRQKKDELTKYLKPRGNFTLIGLGIFMIFFAFLMIPAEIPIYLFLLFAAVGVLLLVIGLGSLLDYPKYTESIERSGQLQWILQDFSQSNSVMDDKLRFGYTYLYARGQGKLLTYSDITRVYQYIHKTNFVEDRRELKYVNREGKELTLCQLKTRGKSDNELRMIIGMLYGKNPSLQVGYQK